MRLNVNQIELIGADRSFEFRSGLNVITGPVATGKTTLVECIRGLLGSGLGGMPPEVRSSVSAIGGEITLQATRFQVVRPFVTTQTAHVDIAGDETALRLPALRSTDQEQQTYGRWLLSRLGIPELQVATSRERADSDTVLLSINDFMLYCHLEQTEIDQSVFGHTHTFKDIKRRYVFEVVYGSYDVDVATLMERRRQAIAELRRLEAKGRNVADFLRDTPLENRAVLERQLEEAQRELASLEDAAVELADIVGGTAGTRALIAELQEVDLLVGEVERELSLEHASRVQAEQLVAELRTHSARLTRSIVAGDLLLDFEFAVCPRCGAPLDQHRTEDGVCYVCQQEESPRFDRTDLVREQDRIQRQVLETQEVVSIHHRGEESLAQKLRETRQEREALSQEIEYRSRSYVSESAERLSDLERRRATTREKMVQLREYLRLVDRSFDDSTRVSELRSQIEQLDAEIESMQTQAGGQFAQRIEVLNGFFREGLERIGVPRLVDGGFTGVDTRTYLPRIDGRRFDELQSLGLQVMVNVAHAIAHHRTAIQLGLRLPSLLIIDGLSANMGYEGLDMTRIESMYQYIADIAEENAEAFQVFVVDNTVPGDFRPFVNVELKDDDKLIPVASSS